MLKDKPVAQRRICMRPLDSHMMPVRGGIEWCGSLSKWIADNKREDAKLGSHANMPATDERAVRALHRGEHFVSSAGWQIIRTR